MSASSGRFVGGLAGWGGKRLGANQHPDRRVRGHRQNATQSGSSSTPHLERFGVLAVVERSDETQTAQFLDLGCDRFKAALCVHHCKPLRGE